MAAAAPVAATAADANVVVAVRVKPFTATERASEAMQASAASPCPGNIDGWLQPGTIGTSHPLSHASNFDTCLWSHEAGDSHFVDQARVYSEIGAPVIDAASLFSTGPSLRTPDWKEVLHNDGLTKQRRGTGFDTAPMP